MKTERFNNLVTRLFQDAEKLMERKGADYARGDAVDDRLDNFRRGGAALGLPMRQVWWVYANKQWDAITTWCRSGRVESEGLRERFLDMICYSCLGYAEAVEEAEDRGEPIDE